MNDRRAWKHDDAGARSSKMASNPAIAAYRSLLKAQRSLFNADLVARTAARAETRLRFMEHAGASADAVPALVQDAIDAADFIRTNVAQTVQNERGNFEFKPTPDHVHVGTEPPPLPPEHVIMGGGGSCGSASKPDK